MPVIDTARKTNTELLAIALIIDLIILKQMLIVMIKNYYLSWKDCPIEPIKGDNK